MPVHLYALTVILVLASFVFALAKRPLCTTLMSEDDFLRRRNLWFAVTLIVFLAHNFWVYIVGVAFLLNWARKREGNQLALYLWLLLAGPQIGAVIYAPGIDFAIIKIDYLRLITLVLLLPTWWVLRQQRDVPRFGFYMPDKILFAYLGWLFLLGFRATTPTDAVREGIYSFIDVFLPYYVASRSLRDLARFREVLAAFVMSAMLVALLGLYEMMKTWLLYDALYSVFDMLLPFNQYLFRGETLRAMVSTGQPIILGYVMAVALGFQFSLWRGVPKFWGIAGILLLIAGAIAPVSRGPWVGVAVFPLLLAATGKQPLKQLTKVIAVACMVGVLLLSSPLAGTIIDHLPFIGTVDAENVGYRQRLIENALIVISNNLFSGTPDVLNTPEMQEMQQAGWIIDIVNSYVGVALASGIVGLSLFVGVFFNVLICILGGMRRVADKDSENYRLGQSLLATLIAILIMIVTVSSIGVIPTIYWTIAGLGVAFAQMSLRNNLVSPTRVGLRSFRTLSR